MDLLNSQLDELTKQRPGQRVVFYTFNTLTAKIKHECKPFLTVSITVKGNSETVIFCVENNSMPVSGIRLSINTKTVLQHNTTLWRHTSLKLLLVVKVLKTSRSRAAFLSQNKQLLLICLKKQNFPPFASKT